MAKVRTREMVRAKQSNTRLVIHHDGEGFKAIKKKKNKHQLVSRMENGGIEC